MAIEANLSARDTPAGRRYEVKVTFFDCLFLILGCIGLALSFEPLIYLCASGHLISRVCLMIAKWSGIIFQAIMITISSIIFFAGVYSVETFYRDVPSDRFLEYIQMHWLLLVSNAVLVGGIVGTLLAHVGSLDQLREYMDKEL